MFATPNCRPGHIDLDAASTPSGSSTIQGNFIGLDVNGTPIDSTGKGIDVGAADGVTIGGAASTARNFIGGGAIGVNADAGADDLTIQNNFIGVQPDGSGEVAPSEAGAVIASENPDPLDVPDRPIITNNLFAGDSTAGQDGLRLSGSRGDITGNDFGRDGTTAAQPFGGDAIEITGSLYQVSGGNQIHNGRATGINIDGGDSNTINGNTIEENGAAAAGPGVRIQNDADINLLGGDPVGNPTDVNTFITNAGDAIEVLGDGSDLNTLLGNLTNGSDPATGSGAGDLMVDLNGDGPGNPMAIGPNDGNQPPTITSATPTSASGTTEPGAPVMLYSADPTGPAQPSQSSRISTPTSTAIGPLPTRPRFRWARGCSRTRARTRAHPSWRDRLWSAFLRAAAPRKPGPAPRPRPDSAPRR